MTLESFIRSITLRFHENNASCNSCKNDRSFMHNYNSITLRILERYSDQMMIVQPYKYIYELYY